MGVGVGKEKIGAKLDRSTVMISGFPTTALQSLSRSAHPRALALLARFLLRKIKLWTDWNIIIRRCSFTNHCVLWGCKNLPCASAFEFFTWISKY